MKWHWEAVDATRSGSAGDVAKLFKNERVKQPSIFVPGAPPADATLLAREVIQNSWDAAREYEQRLLDRDDEAPPFEIDFDFVELAGDAKKSLVSTLGLGELAERAEGKDPKRIGLGGSNALASIDGDTPLSVLRISEDATTGMDGPFHGARSRLYLALVSIGFTQKDEGAGGSYGYGKAGLIRGSAVRTVIAYTCFEERDDDRGVTRRLLGMTYWGPHDEDGEAFTGFARFGSEHEGGVVLPFENEEADELAEALGLRRRSPDDPAQHGTTFLLVEPTVEPEALRTAIERNWWPALVEHRFTVEIRKPDGDRIVPQPKRRPELKAFIRGYELATTPQDNSVSHERSKTFNRATIGGESRKPGRLGLVADPDGWSYPQVVVVTEDEAEAVDHRSLVALVRGPLMVVEYLDAGRAMPFVRGTFVADPEIDDLLRQTEPKAHDSWESGLDSDGLDPGAPEAAKVVLRRIKAEVNDFRRSIKPPTPKRRDIRLPVLEDLFRQVLTGEGSEVPPPPAPPPRPLSINVTQLPELDPHDRDRIRLRATVTYKLSPNYSGPENPLASVEIRYQFIEDGRGGERCPLDITAPPGFSPGDHEGVFVGPVGTEPVSFHIVSHAYSSDWTGRLTAMGDLVESAAEERAGDATEEAVA